MHRVPPSLFVCLFFIGFFRGKFDVSCKLWLADALTKLQYFLVISIERLIQLHV